MDKHGRARSPITAFGGTYQSKNDRGRDRSRSRSRDRGRGRSRSKDRGRDRRSKSRSPEKPAKKKSGWDVPTEDVQTGATVGMPIQAPQMLNETRQARRVYVGNLPGSIPPQEVVDFFNDAMVKAGLNKWAGPPIVQAVHQSLEGGFVFIELRDVDETTALLMYDGVIFKDRQLKVRRPADYNPPPSAGPDPVANPNLYAAVKGLAKIQGVVSTNVTDGPNKVYVGNLPNHLKPDQVKELVEMFGELRAFHLLVDNHDIGRSKGVAFLEYMDPNNTDQAIAGLSGLEVCGRALQCDRATKGKNWEVEKKSLQGLAMAAGLPQGLAPSMQATVLASMGLTPQQAAASGATLDPAAMNAFAFAQAGMPAGMYPPPPGLPAPLSNAPGLPAPLSNAPGLPAPLSNNAGMGLQPL